jgi:predicted NAD/FAD-binding protein
MRIAVIGTGVSGLVAAYLLGREHDLTVFEAQSHVGGHTLTSRIDWQGQEYHVDAGFIVFNEVNYPNLVRLFQKLGVESQATSMSFSVKSRRTGLEYAGTSPNGLFAQRRNLASPRFLGLLRDIGRFNKQGRRLLAASSVSPTLGQLIEQGGYSQAFVDEYLIPMGAAIWSTNPADMLVFPARFFLEFLDNHGLLRLTRRHQWRSVKGGSFRYIEPLTRAFSDRIRLETPVLSVRRSAASVTVRTTAGGAEEFDQVVIATHSDQALKLLEDASDTEREVLGAIRYQANDAALHTDTTVLPQTSRAWASWNYLVPEEPGDRVVLTYNMKKLQCLPADAPTFCVSLNMGTEIDQSKVLKRFRFAHPVFTPRAVRAQERWGEISGVGRTHFCGAYWGNGFHEAGVKSGLAVAASLGMTL